MNLQDPEGEVGLATVTVTGAEVVTLPAASRATAVRVCEPFATAVVYAATAYGAVVFSAPKSMPSYLNCTPMTPTLSEALAMMGTVPQRVAPDGGETMATVGGVVSLWAAQGKTAASKSGKLSARSATPTGWRPAVVEALRKVLHRSPLEEAGTPAALLTDTRAVERMIVGVGLGLRETMLRAATRQQ